MAKLTNLEMVQNILSSMDSDNINTISDTEEAVQVLSVVEESYNNILSRRKWSFLRKTRQLLNASDTTKPTKFIIPDTVTRVDCFNYKALKEGTSPEEFSWKALKYLEPCDFIQHVQSRNCTQLVADGTALQLANDDNVEMCIITNKEPEFWTSFDDSSIYLDNWVQARGTTVVQGNTSVNVVEEKPFLTADTDIQSMPTEMFPLLLAESKSTCWLTFKGIANQKAEQIASRQYIKLREEEPTVQVPRIWLDYGKPPRGSFTRSSRRGLSFHL